MSLPPTQPTSPFQPVERSLSPILSGVIARNFARQRAGASATDTLDQVFDAVMARHPDAPRDMLAKWAATLPPQTSQALNPAPEPRRTGGRPPPTPVPVHQFAPGGTILDGPPVSVNPNLLFNIDPNLLKLADPVPVIKSVDVGGTFEEGAKLAVHGANFAKQPGATSFRVAQMHDNVWKELGEVAADGVLSQFASLRLPAKYGSPESDAGPPVRYRLTVIRNVAANSQGKSTQSVPFEFSVPHLMRADRPAVFESPKILAVMPDGLYAGSADLLVTISNIGNVKILDPGSQHNKPIFPGQSKSLGADDPDAFLFSEDHDGLYYHKQSSLQAKTVTSVIQAASPTGDPAQLRVQVPPTVYPGNYLLQIKPPPVIFL